MTEPAAVRGSPKRTLLLVAPGFPPWGGGVEIYIRNLAQALIHQGVWRVVVVSVGEFGGRRRTEHDGDLRISYLPYQVRISNTRLGATWRRDLKRIIAEERPDLINAHAPVPGLADIAAGVAGDTPFVVTYHMGTMLKNKMPADAGIRAYERWLLPRMMGRADRIITSSDFVQETFLTGFAEKCSTVVPGVDPAIFSPAPELAPDRVLFVASMNRGDERKGLDLLLGAIAALRADRPQLRLVVVGEGNDMARYQASCRSLGIEDHVDFRGRLGGSALVDAYRGSTVMALPSTNDSWPIVLLEAMACGIPAVSTNVGAIPILVEEGRQGFIIEPRDLPALTDRLARILDDLELARRLGRAGREKVEACYTWDRQAARTMEIFDSVLGAKLGA
jgi:phosphatidylinositol alpha-mannosyltransferase